MKLYSPEGNSFVFPRVSMFEIRGKRKQLFREQTLSVLLYSDEEKLNNIHKTIIFHE